MLPDSKPVVCKGQRRNEEKMELNYFKDKIFELLNVADDMKKLLRYLKVGPYEKSKQYLCRNASRREAF